MIELNKKCILKEFESVCKAGLIFYDISSLDLNRLKQNLSIINDLHHPGPHKANIGWAGQDFTHGYIESFYKLADLAVRKMEPSYQDYYVYSIMFNYRHYIELALKELILSFQLSFGLNVIEVDKTHDLDKLITKLSIICNEVLLEELIPIEIVAVIKEFHQLDSKNTAFRYSYDNDGKLHFNYKPRYFDLHKIQEGMWILHEWFDSLLTLFSDGSFSTLYVSSQSIKTFSIYLYENLLKKNSSQISNLLKNIEFKYGDRENEKTFFEISTYTEEIEGEIIINTNWDLPFKICYDTKENRIISISTVDPIVKIAEQ